MRGAYEVGVLKGMVEVLGLREASTPPFRIFVGTSVGAINAAYMVGNSHRGDLGIDGLADIWSNLSVESHLKISWVKVTKGSAGRWMQRPFIDPRPLELLVRRSVDWDVLHENVELGRARALVIAAFNLATGKTAMFAETAPGVYYRPSPDPRRSALVGPISPDHVLGSAAIPLVFTPRRIGHAYYVDGSVRFNTPISPAVRSGAERLMVISVRKEASDADIEEKLDHHPTPLFVIGKLLNAVFLDPFEYDLSVMARFNELFSVLEEALTEEELERVQKTMTKLRGAPYRRLSTLVFTPSEDIAKLASEHIKEHLDDWKLMRIPRWFLRRATISDSRWEADWAAYILFDGSFAAKLIELGRRDALRRADEIREFFEPGKARDMDARD